MPKPYRVKARLPKGRNVFIATFRDHSGRQATKSLGTQDQRLAQRIAADLEHLHRAGLINPSQAPSDTEAKALDLFFGPVEGALIVPSKARDPQIYSRVLEGGLPTELASYVARVFIERDSLVNQVAALQKENDQVRMDLEGLRMQMLKYGAITAKDVPPLKEAVRLFEEHLKTTVTPDHRKRVVALISSLMAYLPPEAKRPSDITVAHLAGWIDSEMHLAKRPLEFRRSRRVRIGRFINWCARTWGYPSIMVEVETPKRGALKREKGPIHWHQLDDVQDALGRLPSPYWKAVVATLAFAGLRLSELIHLRLEDVEMSGGYPETIWVVPHSGHDLKTFNSRRGVKVHQGHLLPLLKEHLDANAGSELVFPMPKPMRRRSRDGGRNPNMWLRRTLERYLLGDTRPRAKKEALLPPGMTPQSLRRTFGSLLLRGKKSVEEVAAAMGNTPDVVREHYARILGVEVEVDF